MTFYFQAINFFLLPKLSHKLFLFFDKPTHRLFNHHNFYTLLLLLYLFFYNFHWFLFSSRHTQLPLPLSLQLSFSHTILPSFYCCLSLSVHPSLLCLSQLLSRSILKNCPFFSAIYTWRTAPSLLPLSTTSSIQRISLQS